MSRKGRGNEVELKFSGIGDKKGVLYWLGSKGGQRIWRNPADGGETAPVEVLASSCQSGDLRMITDWSFGNQNYMSTNVPNSWVAVDFRDYEVNPAVYSLAHSSNNQGVFLRSWALQGSSDGRSWEDIDVRNNDGALSSTSPWVAYATPPTSGFFRYLRVLMKPQGNTTSTHTLPLNCLEFYGTLRPRVQQQRSHWGAPVPTPTPANLPPNGKMKGKPMNPQPTPTPAATTDLPNMPPQGPIGKHDNRDQRKVIAPEQWGLFRRGEMEVAKGDLPLSAFGQWAKGGGGSGGGGKGKDQKQGGRHHQQNNVQEPQEALPCGVPPGTTVFEYSKVGGRDGVVYYLSSNKGDSVWSNGFMSGAVNVLASSIQRGKRSMVVDHTFKDQVFFTRNEPESWVQVSFPTNRVVPTCYMFSQRAAVKDYYPRAWTFEGSNDGQNFFIISTHTDDQSFTPSAPTGVFRVNCTEPYSYFRIKLSPDGNSHGTSALVVSCFEIFGTLL